jgi:hypothetical protein
VKDGGGAIMMSLKVLDFPKSWRLLDELMLFFVIFPLFNFCPFNLTFAVN